MNPWDVETLTDFSFFCCPECIFRSTDACHFKDHALDNHPLSKTFFLKEKTEEKVVKNIKNEIIEEDQVKYEDMCCDPKTFPDIEIKGESSDLPTGDDVSSEHFCCVCNESFPDKKSLILHQSNSHDSFPCQECGQTFKTYKHLLGHMEWVKRSGKSCHQEHKCPGCSKICVSKKALAQHKNEEHVTWPCQKCSRIYPSHKKLIFHQWQAHQFKVCEFCGKEMQKSNFRGHSIVCKSNKNEKNHQCSECPFKTHNQVALDNHRIRYHKNKNNTMLKGVEIDENGLVNCPKCGKKIIIEKYAPHYKAAHKALPPGYPSELIIKCDKCFDEFTSHLALRRHLYAIHKIGKERQRKRKKKLKN